MTAYGGTVGDTQAQRGSAGTIYLKGNTQTHGDLIIDNNAVSGANTEAVENTTFDNITIQKRLSTKLCKRGFVTSFY
jgi:hypothetical protein